MKRFVLPLAAILVLLAATCASAADIKARGYWWMEAVNRGGWDFLKSAEDSKFTIDEKLRTAFYFTANENLRGVLDTQIGNQSWGSGMFQIGAGRNTAAAGASSASLAGAGNIMLRKAYIEYLLPSTKTNVSVGFQTVTLPAAFGGGSPIFDDQVGAAVFSGAINDNISLTAGYARPLQGANTSGSGSGFDVVFASLPITQPGVTITPYLAYAYGGATSGAMSNAGSGTYFVGGFAGPNSDDSNGVRAYWAGLALTSTVLDSFKLMTDFHYGKATYNNNPGNPARGGRSGYLFDIAVDYTKLSWMTPELFFTYSSGENGSSARDGKSERLPVIGLPQNWTIGSFFFGERLELTGSLNGTAGYTRNTLGYWATGISLKNMTFVDKLSHDFNLLYARGNNNVDFLREPGGNLRYVNYGGFLTTKDSLWEVDFNTRYKIYDELTTYLYLGYIHASFNKEVWGSSILANAAQIRTDAGSNAYKIGVGLNYFF